MLSFRQNNCFTRLGFDNINLSMHSIGTVPVLSIEYVFSNVFEKICVELKFHFIVYLFVLFAFLVGVHTYTHTYIFTYIHTYILTYIHTCTHAHKEAS